LEQGDLEKLPRLLSEGCNFQIHSDGGMRAGQGASTGWTLAAWQREALALEGAIDNFSNIIFQHHLSSAC